MKPIYFPEANYELAKPEDMTGEQCGSLHICKCRDTENIPMLISCWEPSPEEWEVLRKQNCIYIAVVSESTHPPLIVFPNNPFSPEPQEVLAHQPPNLLPTDPTLPELKAWLKEAEERVLMLQHAIRFRTNNPPESQPCNPSSEQPSNE